MPVDFHPLHPRLWPGFVTYGHPQRGVDIPRDTNIWWFGEGSAAPAIELVYVFCKKLGIEVDVNRRRKSERNFPRARLWKVSVAILPISTLTKTSSPNVSNPLADVRCPPKSAILFDRSYRCRHKAGDEDALLENCHAIEALLRSFPKPNLLVKDAEVPGGMYSNMVAQLKALNSSDLLDDAMKAYPPKCVVMQVWCRW